MKKTVLVPIADGTEEIEAVTIIDVLRRAGAEVVVASVDALEIVASRGVKIVADCLIGECRARPFDLVVLPGGMPGAEHLRDSEPLKRILMAQNASGRLFAAICAAPAVVLEPHGLLQDRRATCHPGHIHKLSDPTSAQARVVVDGHCITSQGPGTALAFALKLVELLFGAEKAADVAGPMVTD
jgi:4-methyl-5(b-hydroxyethyl)-thiazole monophosphate biosynthesis